MAKGARASSRKANNAKLKSRVFGPIETARTERLSAKLLELAAQPRKKEGVVMEVQEGSEAKNHAVPSTDSKEAEEMDIDQDTSKATSKSKSGRGRIEKKRSSRKASIVFPRYKNGKITRKSKGKK